MASNYKFYLLHMGLLVNFGLRIGFYLHVSCKNIPTHFSFLNTG